MKDNKGHWWCQECKTEVGPVDVTFQESYTACGNTVVWLDESISPADESALEKEALLRFPEQNGKEISEWSNAQIVDLERSAYLAGRRKTLSDQQQMGLLLMDKDGEIEGLKAEVAELKDKLRKTEEISQIATEGLRDASKEVDELKEMLKKQYRRD